MGLYSGDAATIEQAAIYLKIMTIGFIPQTITLMLSAVLRNMEAGIISVIFNTILNYLFIFGIGIFPKMDVAGAALATGISRVSEFIYIFVIFLTIKEKRALNLKLYFLLKKVLYKK